MDETQKSKEFGSSEAASKGGRARAEALTPERRREIAAAGGAAKAEKSAGVTLPRATHEGILRIGGIELACANLEDTTRVLSERTFLAGLGIKVGGALALARKDDEGAAPLPLFVGHKVLRPFLDNDLTLLLRTPIRFRMRAGGIAHGVKAELIPEVCEVWLKARDAGALNTSLLKIVERADILMRGLARVGIIALIDEATGFQYDRPRKDLEQQLEKFLAESLRQWVRTFPADYFKHLCRLRAVDLRSDMKLPQYFGGLTNNLIYRRIAPGLLKKLKERKAERGNSRDKLHQWLSEDMGVRAVLVHVGTVVGLMKINTNYEVFEKQLDTIAPIYPETPGLFDDPKDWQAPGE
jgi:general stress protein YciG